MNKKEYTKILAIIYFDFLYIVSLLKKILDNCHELVL